MKIEMKNSTVEQETEETLVIESGISSLGNFEVIGSLKSRPGNRRVLFRITKNGKAETMEDSFKLLGIEHTFYNAVLKG